MVINSGRNRFGQYSLELDDRTVIVRCSGAISDALGEQYVQALYALIEKIKDKPWAYLCVAPELEGTTLMASRFIRESYTYSSAHNAVIDAYVMSSPLAINQVDKIRRECGKLSPITDHLFENEQKAKHFLNQFLLTAV